MVKPEAIFDRPLLPGGSDHVHTHAHQGPEQSAVELRGHRDLIATYAELVDDSDFAGVGTPLVRLSLLTNAEVFAGAGIADDMQASADA